MRKNVRQDQIASFVAGLLVGCLVFCMALPWGVSPSLLVVSALMFIFVSSVVTYTALAVGRWSTIGTGRIDLFDCSRAAQGLGVSVTVLGVFVATVEKLRFTFSFAPLEAAISASIGLGFYLGLCAILFLYLLRSM
jgi:hypothetical protein